MSSPNKVNFGTANGPNYTMKYSIYNDVAAATMDTTLEKMFLPHTLQSKETSMPVDTTTNHPATTEVIMTAIPHSTVYMSNKGLSLEANTGKLEILIIPLQLPKLLSAAKLIPKATNLTQLPATSITLLLQSTTSPFKSSRIQLEKKSDMNKDSKLQSSILIMTLM